MTWKFMLQMSQAKKRSAIINRIKKKFVEEYLHFKKCKEKK